MIGRLSDRARGAKIAAAAGLLVFLVLHAIRIGPRTYPSYDDARRDAAAFTDREITFGGDVEKASAGGFVVRTWDDIAVTVRGALAAGQEGYWISGRAIFRADGTLDVLTSHVYRYRFVKNLMAVLPVIVVVWAFFRRYAFDARRFAFRERRRGEARDA